MDLFKESDFTDAGGYNLNARYIVEKVNDKLRLLIDARDSAHRAFMDMQTCLVNSCTSCRKIAADWIYHHGLPISEETESKELPKG